MRGFRPKAAHDPEGGLLQPPALTLTARRGTTMSQAAQWTRLVYMAGDNNLEEDYSPDYSDLAFSKDGK